MLMAEIVKHFVPGLVDIHNYSTAHSMQQKLYNWNTLNQKVFRKLGFLLSKNDIDKVTSCVPEAIERALRVVQQRLSDYSASHPNPLSAGHSRDSPEQVAVRPAKGPVPVPQPRPVARQTDADLLLEKDSTIRELRETVEVRGRQIMELKIKKLEQLVKLKDSKIQTLTNKLTAAGI